MMKNLGCTAVAVFVVGLNVRAESLEVARIDGSASTLKVESVAPTQNKVEGDLDQEITNPKLRAESGSKSRFSGSVSMIFKGGALSRPFGADRPNLAGLPENQVDTSLDAGLKMRYRSNKHNSFTMGVGLGIRTPLQGDVNSRTNQVNIGDPILGYNLTWAGWGVQNSANLYGSYGTSKESVRMDQFASLAADYNAVKSFGRLQVGLTSSVYQNFYENKPGENPETRNAEGSARLDSRTSLAIAVNPNAEYMLTDRIALRTSMGLFRWQHLYGDPNNWSLIRTKQYMSLGVGWAVTRDVYLYPNVQFLARDIRSDYTNVGLNATLNVF